MKYLSFFTAVLIFYSFQPYTFAQLDSVWYEGPSVGSVAGGELQSTDNFTDTPIISQMDAEEFPINQFGGPAPIEMFFNWDESQLAEYVYVEDSNTLNKSAVNGGQTVLLKNFFGMQKLNRNPPDPTLAVGPDHIMGCVNRLFKIWDKEGNLLKTISAEAWFQPVSPYTNHDPQVIYDHYEGRWFYFHMEYDLQTQTAGNLIAYSDDDNPLGEWYIYRLDTKMHGTVPSNTWGDYPKVGFDEEAFYIMTRCSNFGPWSFQYSKIRIISKAELYASNGGPLNYTDIWNIRTPGLGSGGQPLDCIHPAITYTPGSGQYFLWAAGWLGAIVAADYYVLYKITNPLTAPSLRGKVLPAQFYYSALNAKQLGGGTPIEALGFVTRAPIVRDGFLYVAHGIRNSVYPFNTSIKYIKVDLSTNTVMEEVEFGAEGYYYLEPALAIDKDHNIAITYSRSADTEYCGAFYSTRHAIEPPGLGPSQVLAEGLGNYDVIGSQGRNRWGDYMGIYLDPENEYDIWMNTQYATATDLWGTRIAKIRMEPFTGVYAFANPLTLNFGDVEVGTTSEILSCILSNYGDADLIITDMPSSVGDFNLETTLSLPHTMQTYDSLEVKFSCSPTVAGVCSELYTIFCNDPDFSGISLEGNGYNMDPAEEKTIYASSGIQNNGEILTINKTTGTGTSIGPSLFDEVKSVAIDPNSGTLYGIVPYNNNVDIVRVNSGGGDSYYLFNIDLPFMEGIAFDTTGNLYGILRSGEIYTIDLTDSTYTLVADAEGSFSALTFHPETNELWVTSRSFVPPNNDAIIKIDITTGDTTIVGHTGLGKITNDIVFDEGHNLYGVIGASTETNDFISIDVSNGVGTIVGSVGFQHILGLAYIESVTSVDYENNLLPKQFSLKQNYPNPFNPKTTIRYEIPERSFIALKIYNLLGREVVTLVSEENDAGYYSIEFDASTLSSGIYFYRLQAGSFVETKKMMLLK
jgi:hypothetical protein